MLLVLFLIIAMAAAGVNRSLTNAAREKDGDDLLEDAPYGSAFEIGRGRTEWQCRSLACFSWHTARYSGIRA